MLDVEVGIVCVTVVVSVDVFEHGLGFSIHQHKVLKKEGDRLAAFDKSELSPLLP